MKKIVTLAVAILAFAVAAAAQPKAIGLRLGYGAEVSYQQYMRGGSSFLEADFGLVGFDAINVAAAYDWYMYQGNGFGVYGGVGAAVGFSFNKDHSGIHLALAPQIGLEYEFKIPLQISLDWRPALGWCSYEYKNSGHFYNFLYPALGLRYCF